MTYPPGQMSADGQLVAVVQESVVFTTVAVGGLPGAAVSTRLAGGTTGGAPASGTWALNDLVADTTGALWLCTAAGSPGTWAQIGTVLAGAVTPAVKALTYGASVTVNAAAAGVFTLTLTGSAATIAAPSNPADGQEITLRVTQGGSGSYTLAFASAFDFGAAGAPTLSTGVGKADILKFQYSAALAKWCCTAAPLGF